VQQQICLILVHRDAPPRSCDNVIGGVFRALHCEGVERLRKNFLRDGSLRTLEIEGRSVKVSSRQPEKLALSFRYPWRILFPVHHCKPLKINGMAS
jgi:hypothetical protein